jgi:Tol biopolymer transport system component
MAFVWRQGAGGGFNLYAITLGGRPPVRLTDGLWIDGNPSWGPDGSSIAFDSNRDGGRVGIYIIASTGGEPRWVTRGQAPSWSPSGDAIAFTRLEGDAYDVLTMRPDGTGVRNLTAHPSDDVEPCWSPDGRRIAFASDRGGDFDIFVLDLADGSLQPLTSGPADDRHPAWSPDGSSIAFARSGGTVASSAIFIVELAGGPAVRMTSGPLYDVTPSWGP